VSDPHSTPRRSHLWIGLDRHRDAGGIRASWTYIILCDTFFATVKHCRHLRCRPRGHSRSP
jgi:hypothetical protein